MASTTTKNSQEILNQVLDEDLSALQVAAPGGVALRTDVIQNDATALTPKFAAIALAGSGDVVAAVASKKIRVLSLYGHGTTTGTIKFQSGASTDKTGVMNIANGNALNLAFSPVGHFETVAGEKLNAVLATMTAFNGVLTYVEV